jgi:hypothetical protein
VRWPKLDELAFVVVLVIAGAAFLFKGVVPGVVCLFFALCAALIFWTPLRSHFGWLREDGLSEVDQKLVSDLQALVRDFRDFIKTEGIDAQTTFSDGSDREMIGRYLSTLRPRIYWMADRLISRGFLEEEARSVFAKARNGSDVRYVYARLSEQARRLGIEQV